MQLAEGSATLLPVSLFFIGNLIYFLIPILETFDSSLYVQTQMMPYKSWIMPSVEGRLADRSISMDEYAVAYNAASTSNAKLLLITMVFLISIGFAVVAMKKPILRRSFYHVTGGQYI